MTHLDVGFTNEARNVCDIYFEKWLPAAISAAKQLDEENSEESFVYLEFPWLILEYLGKQITTIDFSFILYSIYFVCRPMKIILQRAPPANGLPHIVSRSQFIRFLKILLFCAFFLYIKYILSFFSYILSNQLELSMIFFLFF